MTSSRRETSPIDTATPGGASTWQVLLVSSAADLCRYCWTPVTPSARLTRSSAKAARLASLGAETDCVRRLRPAAHSRRPVRSFSPDLVLHELTDLPDAVEDLPKARLLNARIRVEGTRNLIDAMDRLGRAKDSGPKHRVDTGSRSRGRRRQTHSSELCSRRTASSSATALSMGPAHTTRVNFRQRHACTSTPPPLEPWQPLDARSGILTVVDE